MVDVSDLVRFTLGEKTLRLVMDIAAALERYRIVMEGPAGVRLRKLNHIRTIRGTTAWDRYGWRKIGNLTTRIRCNSKHDENESKS